MSNNESGEPWQETTDAPSGSQWEAYWKQMELWEAARAYERQTRYPGSTRHVGRPHSSRHNPQFHADKEVTDLDGKTTKEHSTDPRDIEFGWKIEEGMREIRNRERDGSD